jgi:predicted nucleic acid-binding Zn ribbon protein
MITSEEGRWVYNTDDFTPHVRCSVCGYNKPIVAGSITQEPKKYCNNCGHKMKDE